MQFDHLELRSTKCRVVLGSRGPPAAPGVNRVTNRCRILRWIAGDVPGHARHDLIVLAQLPECGEWRSLSSAGDVPLQREPVRRIAAPLGEFARVEQERVVIVVDIQTEIVLKVERPGMKDPRAAEEFEMQQLQRKGGTSAECLPVSTRASGARITRNRSSIKGISSLTMAHP